MIALARWASCPALLLETNPQQSTRRHA